MQALTVNSRTRSGLQLVDELSGELLARLEDFAVEQLALLLKLLELAVARGKTAEETKAVLAAVVVAVTVAAAAVTVALVVVVGVAVVVTSSDCVVA